MADVRRLEAGAPPPVAFLCHPYHRGGVTRWMVDQAAEWRRQGGRSWFVVPRPRRPLHGGGNRPAMVELLESCPPAERPSLVTPAIGPEFDFGTAAYRTSVYAAAFVSAVPAGVPVIVSDDPSVWSAAAGAAGRNPLVGVLHADDDAYYELARLHGPRCAAVVSVSRRIAGRSAPGLAGVVQATIPCGVPQRERTVGAHAGPRAELRLVWVGRMDERQKRVSDLPKIAAALREEGVAFRLDVIGDGGERAAVERAVGDAGLGAQVRLLGWRSTEDVWRALCAGDILLAPSNFEGLPVAVMESLAAGCAVVASRVSGVEDYEHDPRAAACLWVHAVGDVAGAVRLIRTAAAVPAPERAARATAFAREEFSIETCVRRYASVVRGLAPARGAPAGDPAWRAPLLGLVSRPLALTRAARVWVAGLGRDSAGSRRARFLPKSGGAGRRT